MSRLGKKKKKKAPQSRSSPLRDSASPALRDSSCAATAPRLRPPVNGGAPAPSLPPSAPPLAGSLPRSLPLLSALPLASRREPWRARRPRPTAASCSTNPRRPGDQATRRPGSGSPSPKRPEQANSKATWKTSRVTYLHPAMSAPNSDSNMQQLVPIAPPGKASGGDSGKELVVVDPAGKSSGGVKLREDEEDLEVKLRRIMENVPVRVSNTSGSSAGSGSGDFHQYRQMRRREQDRIARMDADYQKRKEAAEFELRREERLKAAEERTAKKRLKRQKKKQRKKEKRAKTGSNGGEEPNRVESSDDDDEGLDVDDKSKQ